ncbi:MAG: hypothetical protein ACI4AA_08520 [Lachnospiraceae bacterium]
MNNKYWALWGIINLIMGVCGYVLLGIGFVIGLANAGNGQTAVYVALAITALILLVLFHFGNRILYRVLSERSEKEIPAVVELAGNLLAWAIVIIVYLIMSFI